MIYVPHKIRLNKEFIEQTKKTQSYLNYKLNNGLIG